MILFPSLYKTGDLFLNEELSMKTDSINQLHFDVINAFSYGSPIFHHRDAGIENRKI